MNPAVPLGHDDLAERIGKMNVGAGIREAGPASGPLAEFLQDLTRIRIDVPREDHEVAESRAQNVGIVWNVAMRQAKGLAGTVGIPAVLRRRAEKRVFRSALRNRRWLTGIRISEPQEQRGA